MRDPMLLGHFPALIALSRIMTSSAVCVLHRQQSIILRVIISYPNKSGMTAIHPSNLLRSPPKHHLSAQELVKSVFVHLALKMHGLYSNSPAALLSPSRRQRRQRQRRHRLQGRQHNTQRRPGPGRCKWLIPRGQRLQALAPTRAGGRRRRRSRDTDCPSRWQ